MPNRASYDPNLRATAQAVSSTDNLAPVNLWADPTTHGLITSSATTATGQVTPALLRASIGDQNTTITSSTAVTPVVTADHLDT